MSTASTTFVCCLCGHLQEGQDAACSDCGARQWEPTTGEPRMKALMPEGQGKAL